MTQHSTDGVSYSGDHFSSEFIDFLVQSPTEMLLGAEGPAGPDTITLTNDTPESAFRRTWAELTADPKFAAALESQGHNLDTALAEFNRRLAAPVPPALDQRVAGTLTGSYQTRAEADGYVHYIDDKPILTIKNTVASAPLVSSNAEIALQVVFVVVDVLSVVAAIAGIMIETQKSVLVKAVQPSLKDYIKQFFSRQAAREFQGLKDKLKGVKKTEETVKLIQSVLSKLRGGGAGLKDVATAFLSSQSPLEIAIDVVQLLASIALILATAGSALVAKVIQLAVAIAFLVSDAIALAVALEKPRVAH
ncbi:MAG: hypothetical protein ACRD1U_07780 [Vicinamibacterales bacterium]